MIVREPIKEDELVENAPQGVFVKVVVDVAKGILAFGCELHFDCYKELLESGSKHEDLWGANFYPEKKAVDFVSLINIRPPANRSMEIKDQKIKEQVRAVVKRLIV